MRTGGQGLVTVLMSTILIGCSPAGLGLGPQAPPRTYDLVTLALFPSSRVARRPWQIVVHEPTAIRALAGDRIMIKPAPAEIVYFPKAVWSDRLTRLVQARLIETLQRSGRFAAVSNGRERVEADLEITTEIRDFQIELVSGDATAIVAVFSKLVDQRRGRVVASRGFSAHSPAGADHVGAGVEALNTALQNVLPEVARWAAAARYKAPAERVDRQRERSYEPPRQPPAQDEDPAPEQAPTPKDGLISRKMKG